MQYCFRKLILLTVITLFLPAAVIPGCSLFPKEEDTLAPPLAEPKEITYETEEAKIGYIEDSIQRSAYFVPVMQKSLYFRYRSGRIKTIHVKPGDTVKAGDVVAELLTDGLEREIQFQELTVDSCRKACTYAEQLAEIEIKAAKDRLRVLAEKLDNMLKNSGAYAASEIESIENEKANQEILLAKLGLNHSNTIDMKKNELTSAELKLSQLQEELEQCRLVSPVDGIVTYTVGLNEGDTVDSYKTIVTVADPKELRLEYQGSSANDFKLGMKVDVIIDDVHYQGEVILTASSVPFEEMEKYKETVHIKIKDIPEGIEKGDRANIKIIRNFSENAVIIPKKAVRTYMGKSVVYILKDGLRMERYVEKGVESVNEVEITQGLKAGELVIVD